MTRLNFCTLWITILVSAACYLKAGHDPYGSYLLSALEVIEQKGLEPIGRERLFGAAVSGMAEAHDPHSAFIPAADRQQYLGVLDQQFSGIGVSVEKDRASGQLVVRNTVIGQPQPAHDAGMRSGDQILAVAGQPVADKSFEELIALIRGPRGEPVSITVIHEGETESVTLQVPRADIVVDSVLGDRRQADTYWNYALSSDPRIAYFQLTDFGDRTAEELQAALADLRAAGGIEAAIVDVRDNAGGYLSTARDVCDLFLDRGTIVTTRGRGGRIQETYDATSAGTQSEIPLAVLINGESASASEIFAACMQDQQRAKIIGTRSFGKGSVQQMIPTGDGGILKLTTSTYHRPSGKNIHRRPDSGDDADWGVRPDEGMELPLSAEAEERRYTARTAQTAFRPEPSSSAEMPEPAAEDPQLQKAIEYLQQQLESR
jgi:carboxyl-terminal processing protease